MSRVALHYYGLPLLSALIVGVQQDACAGRRVCKANGSEAEKVRHFVLVGLSEQRCYCCKSLGGKAFVAAGLSSMRRLRCLWGGENNAKQSRAEQASKMMHNRF